MTTTITIDTSNGIIGMSESEKNAFVDVMDLAGDYGMAGSISDGDIALYKTILQERRDRMRGETY